MIHDPGPVPYDPAGPHPDPGRPGPPAWLTERLRSGGCVFPEDEADLIWSAADGGCQPGDRGARTAMAWAMVERRVTGEPLELVVGWAEVGGVRVPTEAGVFVPRRRSDLLVSVARDHLPGAPGMVGPASDGMRPPVVVDLGCGTGALGLAVVADRPGVELYAVDVDPAAVRLARSNLAGRGTVHLGDGLAGLPHRLRGRVDLVVANLPYVPSGQLHLLPAEARWHEPDAALDGGPDGLDHLRRTVASVAVWLRPGGRLLMEVAPSQAAAATAEAQAAGGTAGTVTDPDLDVAVLIVRPR
ncbi:MAG: putative protein N(5)-glutamine methyltransferase [Acidimicrobiales bacterium]